MPQIINTNMASLNAQRNLNSSQNSLATALTRLSSGLRINSAKDDAAGLAISDRFTTQIRGLNQAVRNANDGISLSQTGEGALAEVSNNLQRIRELAVQAANATNSDSDRAALDLEVQQRLAEVDRIASQTNFNGRKILDGSFGNASFQVGADAGQTIVLNLEGSTRVADIGAIASATSGALGASAVDGHINVTPTNLDFFGTGTPATAGSIELTGLTDFNFDAGTAEIKGTSSTFTIDPTAVGGLDFSQPMVPASAATTTTGDIDFSAAIDFSGAGADAHLTIEDESGTFMLALDEAGVAGVVADETVLVGYINTQLGLQGSNTTVEWVGAAGGVGQLKFSSGVDGAASTSPILTVGAALDADGGAEDIAGVDMTSASTTAGVNYSAATAFSIQVDGQIVDFAEPSLTGGQFAADLVDAINSAHGLVAPASLYTASYDSATNEMTITGPDDNAVDVIVSSTILPLATYSGSTAFAAGLYSSAGVAGTVAVPDESAVINIDGKSITLDQDYYSLGGLAAALESKMEAVGGDAYTFTTDAATGSILIERNSVGSSSTAIEITASTALEMPPAIGIAGDDAIDNNNATFYVDGNPVTLAATFGDYSLLAGEISAQLADYSAAYDAVTGQITITKDGSVGVVNITGADVNATNAGFGFATGEAGTSQGSLTLDPGDFSIAVGDGTPVPFVGTYASPQELATAINRELSGINAEITPTGELKLMSTQQITMSGAEAGATGAMAFTTLVVDPTVGSLDAVNVMDVLSANETIVRIDSALTGVSNLRSTFGAIQNRFESTISNLTATGENLTSARSRIMDADFAQETAALTRAQILQQAGTAMLAQANQIPQNVLSLLG